MPRKNDNDTDFHATDRRLEDLSHENDREDRLILHGAGERNDAPPEADEFLVEEGWHRRSLSDPEIFGYFYDKYYDRIFGFLYNMVRSRDEAEELTQATFVKAFEKRNSFVFRKAPIGAWFFQIARRKALKAKQAQKHKRQVPLEFLKPNDGNLIEFRPGPDHLLLSKEDQARLYRALDQMDPECQSWLVMHHLEGLSTPQLARIAEVKVGTMKSRLSRCLEKMRDIMKGL